MAYNHFVHQSIPGGPEYSHTYDTRPTFPPLPQPIVVVIPQEVQARCGSLVGTLKTLSKESHRDVITASRNAAVEELATIEQLVCYPRYQNFEASSSHCIRRLLDALYDFSEAVWGLPTRREYCQRYDYLKG
jgi:hypothetical protein